jgi:hypothetical protein
LSQLCKALPKAGVQGVSGALGGLGGPTGSLELVTNYGTGQVSGFAAGGASVGWNGGASGAAFSGVVFGVNGNNSNYSGGFTAATGSIGSPVAHVGPQATISSSSGGLTGTPQQMIPDNQVVSVTVGVNASLVAPPISGTVAFTNYSSPLQLGKYWSLLGNPSDAALFLATQVCKAAGY